MSIKNLSANSPGMNLLGLTVKYFEKKKKSSGDTARIRKEFRKVYSCQMQLNSELYVYILGHKFVNC